MHPNTKTARPRLYWREWRKTRLGAYAKRTGYLVVPTDAPEATLAIGKTPKDGRFYSFYTAAALVLKASSLRKLVANGHLPREADYFRELREGDWGQSVEEFARTLTRSEKQQLDAHLLAEVRRHGLTIDTDHMGWWRIYYKGLVGFAGDTLKDALQKAYAANTGKAYLLAVPCYNIWNAPQGAPYPNIGTCGLLAEPTPSL